MNKKEKLSHHIHLWLKSWIELAQSIVQIVSFTLILPSWDFKYIRYRISKVRERKLNEQKE